jgi:quercetin dioxygenase-like cupin family protein
MSPRHGPEMDSDHRDEVRDDWLMEFDELPMTREVVLDAALLGLTVERVEVRRIRMAPHLAPGAHVHNGPVLGNVVEGSVLFQVEDGPRLVLGPGDVFFEPANVRISHFDALEDGATFLGYFPLAPGQEPDITMLDA